MINIDVNVQNRVDILKGGAANTILIRYEAANAQKIITINPITTLGWSFFGMTWDIAAGATGEVRGYLDGVQTGATLVGLGTWLGDLANTGTLIGAASTTPNFITNGNIGPVPVWSDALSPDEMRYLGTP